ncbi:phosphohistidine phosphatase [Catalinimonas alkaloidigena]|uniref:SixA phosphatase family protein n=1 Tax=Catalinimonas alkaloidigena TaxID=1075417 RepID=UPI0024067029|nr:histidine phosphatase family protein [Catalinimonas alkaloidigena]MDF9795917.1 phosphohistidine phosphatase [Catalinimonas alkaloidigena]
MKTLLLIRHAKSSWDDPTLDDFDRPLNKRGKNDAPKMGKRLKKKKIHPDLMVSSTAKRAKKTALAIAGALDYPEKHIQWRDELYHAAPETALKVMQRIDNKVEQLFLFGHNPGLTDFANLLCSTYTDNIVTTGIYALQLDITSWQDAQLNQKAKLLFYDYPKKG